MATYNLNSIKLYLDVHNRKVRVSENDDLVKLVLNHTYKWEILHNRRYNESETNKLIFLEKIYYKMPEYELLIRNRIIERKISSGISGYDDGEGNVWSSEIYEGKLINYNLMKGSSKILFTDNTELENNQELINLIIK